MIAKEIPQPNNILFNLILNFTPKQKNFLLKEN